MEAIVGSGKYTYKVHEDWAKVPAGIEMKPAAVAVDPHDRIYCFNRSAEHPVVVFDRDGEFLFSWGAGMFRFPHAIRFDDAGLRLAHRRTPHAVHEVHPRRANCCRPSA